MTLLDCHLNCIFEWCVGWQSSSTCVSIFFFECMGGKKDDFFVYIGTSPKGLFKCPPSSAHPPYSWLRCDCFNAQKCGCCNYHLHKQDSSFIDMLPLIRQELGSETMAEATRGLPAPGTRDRPASSVNADDQQKRPVIHCTLAFLINFQSALLGVLVWWFDPQICSWM